MKNKNDNILRQILLKNQMKNNLFCTVITKIYLGGGTDLISWGKKSNLIILGKNRDRIDCFCRFDLTQVNTINFLKEWINPLYFEKKCDKLL